MWHYLAVWKWCFDGFSMIKKACVIKPFYLVGLNSKQATNHAIMIFEHLTGIQL